MKKDKLVSSLRIESGIISAERAKEALEKLRDIEAPLSVFLAAKLAEYSIENLAINSEDYYTGFIEGIEFLETTLEQSANEE